MNPTCQLHKFLEVAIFFLKKNVWMVKFFKLSKIKDLSDQNSIYTGITTGTWSFITPTGSWQLWITSSKQNLLHVHTKSTKTIILQILKLCSLFQFWQTSQQYTYWAPATNIWYGLYFDMWKRLFFCITYMIIWFQLHFRLK